MNINGDPFRTKWKHFFKKGCSNSANLMSARLAFSRKFHTAFVSLPTERTKVVTMGAPLNRQGFATFFPMKSRFMSGFSALRSWKSAGSPQIPQSIVRVLGSLVGPLLRPTLLCDRFFMNPRGFSAVLMLNETERRTLEVRERGEREQCTGEEGADDCSSVVGVWFEGGCYVLILWPGQKCHSRWCTGRKWHILMAVMRGSRVGGNCLMKWDEVKKIPLYSHRLTHRKTVTSELHHSCFRSMTITQVIPKIAEVTHPDLHISEEIAEA